MLRRPAAGYAAHAAGKGALLAYTRSLAKELGPRGIRVHVVSPGLSLTPLNLATITEEDRETVRRKTPTRRLSTPDDLAGLLVFLASDLASSATMLEIDADGGLAEIGT